jgi:SEC-C motif domain protein
VSCVCGLEPSTEKCCGRYIHGGQKPPTAEALMRSRYSAYVLGEIDYIVATHDPERRHEVDPTGAREWSKDSEWEGLTIHRVERGGVEDQDGVVEFTARYVRDGHLVPHREHATFRRVDGDWFYVDGDILKPKPVVREGRKVGRNEVCPCGSGKKYKKCHGR